MTDGRGSRSSPLQLLCTFRVSSVGLTQGHWHWHALGHRDCQWLAEVALVGHYSCHDIMIQKVQLMGTRTSARNYFVRVPA